MSALTSKESPMTPFTGKRPPSSWGAMHSMTMCANVRAVDALAVFRLLGLDNILSPTTDASTRRRSVAAQETGRGARGVRRQVVRRQVSAISEQLSTDG